MISARSSSIRLYTDEDVDGRLATALQADEFDVLSCHHAGNSGHGHSDDWQLMFAVDDRRAILTHNIRDFTALSQHWAASNRSHFGILLVHQIEISQLIARMMAFLSYANALQIFNATLWLP
ncbi:MAG: DUF5615 family PIN-like protein [Thermomicrobiales bacterium]